MMTLLLRARGSKTIHHSLKSKLFKCNKRRFWGHMLRMWGQTEETVDSVTVPSWRHSSSRPCTAWPLRHAAEQELCEVSSGTNLFLTSPSSRMKPCLSLSPASVRGDGPRGLSGNRTQALLRPTRGERGSSLTSCKFADLPVFLNGDAAATVPNPRSCGGISSSNSGQVWQVPAVRTQ